MRRTRLRPLPAGRVSVAQAGTFGTLMAVAGLGILADAVNLTTLALALCTLVSYLAVYTPAKRITPYATLIGAVPGALPILIGWTASRGDVSAAGVSLFSIVFCWQLPHFMAIAWLYRDDYQAAGLPTLAVLDREGRRAARQALLGSALLLPLSMLPVLTGMARASYLIFAIALGAFLLHRTIHFVRERSDAAARALFISSIAYLPLLLIDQVVTAR
jgi:heme o synthase